MDYEILDHTADACIRVYGKSFDELFENAARAMMELITDRERINPSQEIEIEVRGETKEELLVHWLQEILFLHEVKKMVFKDFRLNLISETHAKGKAIGEKINIDKHELSFDIKAVTYHNLKIEPINDKLKVDIVFDV
ncbi:MAG TPA: archease [Thermodesulfobacteriota bacterium]|nr:archease [Thermodesulfobacteriota bacterium]